MDMNNILLTYGDYKISLVQHKNNSGFAYVEELMIWGPEGGDHIITYSNDLESFIAAINEAKRIIDHAIEGAQLRKGNGYGN